MHVIDACRGLVPDVRLEGMLDLVRHGEPGIALENLGSELDDRGAALDEVTLSQIEQLGTQMGLRSDYWTRLRRTAFR
jgi:hypothetical protein